MICVALIIGLTPPSALPAYLPGDDIVIYRRETIDNCETLTGKHATVTDIAWNKYARKPAYDVNLQGWGDFERHTENIITRRQWEVMREDWMRWNWYPSWWMPWIEREPQ